MTTNVERRQMAARANQLRQELESLETRLQEIETTWRPRSGELVEVSDPEEDEWHVRPFSRMAREDEWMWWHERVTDRNIPVYLDDTLVGWTRCRPLTNPDIIQRRTHTPSDPMPCDEEQLIVVWHRNGVVQAGKAAAFWWGDQYAGRTVDKWAPLP